MEKLVGALSPTGSLIGSFQPNQAMSGSIFRVVDRTSQIPAGGTEGQVLTKVSDNPYDMEWRDAPGDLTYIHNQNSASAVWNITHNLGKYPAVSISDSAGSKVMGDILYLDTNSLVITFEAEFSGVAYLN